jgi:hypothetical protein
MSAARTGLVLGAAVLLAPALLAQTVDEIVARNVAARGGRAALAAVKAIRMTGHAFGGPGRQAIVRREIVRPNRIRTEFEFQGTTGVYVWNGTTGWQVSPLDGSFDAQPITGEAAALSAEQSDFEGPLVDWKAKGHKVALVGRETLPGGAADHLAVTLKSGAVRHLWIDAGSGLLVKSGSRRKVRGHDVEFEVLYGDYRDAGGVQIARSIETGVVGRPQRMRIKVETVELNPKIDEAAFRRPAGLR